MADEEKTEAQPGTEQTKASGTEEKPNYEELYKAQQKEVQELTEKAKKAEETLDTVAPYVDWDAISGKKPAEQTQPEEEPEQLSKQELEKMRQEMDAKYQHGLLAMQFRMEHPDLRPYEKTLIIPKLVELRKAKPRMSPEDLLNETAKWAKEFLEQERAKGRTAAESQEAEKKKSSAKGLEAAGSTAPSSDAGGESAEEYAASRRKRLAKMKGVE